MPDPFDPPDEEPYPRRQRLEPDGDDGDEFDPSLSDRAARDYESRFLR